MSDRLRATDRFDVSTHFVPNSYDHGAVLRAAERLRAIETARLARRAAAWLRRLFGAAPAADSHRGAMLSNARAANELSRLNDRELADIGLQRADIARVAAGSYAAKDRTKRPAETSEAA